MAEPISGVKYDPADLTDPNNPLARYHAEGKIAAAQADQKQRLTEDEWQFILTEGKIAAAMADMEARQAAAEADAKAFEDIFNYNQYGKIEAAIQAQQNPGLFLEPPKK
jgi:hypothetical protein